MSKEVGRIVDDLHPQTGTDAACKRLCHHILKTEALTAILVIGLGTRERHGDELTRRLDIVEVVVGGNSFLVSLPEHDRRHRLLFGLAGREQ